VRKWCLNKQKIKYQNHKKWFEKKINDKNIIMYIVENEKKEKIGQVRLEKSKEKSFNINLNLNPSFFGKGYGNIIIKKVTKLLIRDNLEVREIIAEILDKNVVSQKAFEKAGYFFSHKILKNKQTLSIFKFEI
jgi:RimJ/RimL family protein N-acetyltransferase